MSPAENAPDPQAEPKTPQQKKPRRWLRRLMGVTILIVAAIAALWLIRVERILTAHGSIMTADDALVRTPVKAPVREILVETADLVEKGQPIVQLEDTHQRSEVLRVESRLAEAQAEIQRLQAQQAYQQAQRADRIAQARAELAELLGAQAVRKVEQQRKIEVFRVTLAAAEERLASLEELAGRGAASEEEIRQARREADLARARLAEASIEREEYHSQQAEVIRRRIEALQADPSELYASELEVQRRKIRTLESELKIAREQLEQRTVRSPLAGRIFMHSIAIGQVVDASEVIGQVFTEGRYVVTARLPEGNTWFLREGQEVQVEPSAYPESDFSPIRGRIDWVSMIVSPRASGDGTITFEAELEDPDDPEIRLKPGMTAEVRVHAGRTRLLWRLIPMRIYDRSTSPGPKRETGKAAERNSGG